MAAKQDGAATFEDVFKLPTELLEPSNEKGIYFMQDNAFEGNKGDLYCFAQFNPKRRLLVTGGNNYIANMWNLTGNDFSRVEPI